MEELKSKLEDAIEKAQKIIDNNTEWGEVYQEYADWILQNTEKVKKLKDSFHKWAPFKYYLTVGEMQKLKNTLHISVRYQGQEVAIMTLNEKKGVTISTNKFDKEGDKNKKYFSCPIKLENVSWTSKEATEFRKYFATNPERTKKDNEEHRIESMLISEFSKDSAKDKKLCNIQPTDIANFPFSMPTILSASKKEAKEGRGHIDILTRNSGKIVVIELKDENKSSEPIAKVLQQATSYAVFLINLLRSKTGEQWYKIWGFKSKIPEQIVIRVCSAMPKVENYDKDKFETFTLPCGKDILEYHWLYFEEDGKEITDIDTSLT